MGKPTDKEIAEAFDDINADVTMLRMAAIVLEEYATMEFRAGRISDKSSAYAYGLTADQAEGIQYMAGHVRDLVTKLDIAFDRAFGRGTSA
jgi:hypothetical protein